METSCLPGTKSVIPVKERLVWLYGIVGRAGASSGLNLMESG